MPTLTTSGSPTFNGDSSCTIDATGPDDVTAPASLLNSSQHWFAARITTTFASTADPYAGGDFRIYQFGIDTDQTSIFFLVATDVWAARRTVANSAADAASGAQTFSAGAKFTLIASPTSTQTRLSVNGAAFIATAKAAGAITDTTFHIGNRADGTRAAACAYYWAAAGLGALTDADAAALHANGDSDPPWGSLPAQPTFLWTANNTTYFDVPTAPFPTGLRRFPLGV
jgi:hypothetical protein